jgi:hypothetical protein
MGYAKHAIYVYIRAIPNSGCTTTTSGTCKKAVLKCVNGKRPEKMRLGIV